MGGIMSLILQGSTSGSVTLQEPAVAGTTVLTLPAVSGTVLTTTSPKVGNVLQVIQSPVYKTQATNSTTTYADTGLSASITPTSASSKILVIVSQSVYKSAGNSGNAVDIKLFRGATDLGQLVYVQGYTGTAVVLYSIATFQYLDSPATTSATTYKTQFANFTAASLVSVQPDNNGPSTITLMEIAA